MPAARSSAGMPVGDLKIVYRYPVKSVQGERLRQAEVTWQGLLGDHALAVADVGGAVLTGKQMLGAPLLTCFAQAVVESETIRYKIRVPGPMPLEGWHTDPMLPEALARLLRREVMIVDAGPGTRSEWLTVSGSKLPVGMFADFAPLHLVTTSSIAAAEAAGHHQVLRRVRPQLVIATHESQAGFPELGWVGRCIQVGKHVRLMVTMPTERCALPGRAQHKLGADPDLLRWFKSETANNFGVYAAVVNPGVVRENDPVVLL